MENYQKTSLLDIFLKILVIGIILYAFAPVIQQVLPGLVVPVSDSTTVSVKADSSSEDPVQMHDPVTGVTFIYDLEHVSLSPAHNARYVTDPNQPSNCAIHPDWPQAIQKWCGWITQYAHEQGLDPNIIAAQVLQESGGNPNAPGAACEVGLIQIVPSGGKLGEDGNCDMISGSADKFNSKYPWAVDRPTYNKLKESPVYALWYGIQMIGGHYQNTGNYYDALTRYNGSSTYADIVIAHYVRITDQSPE